MVQYLRIEDRQNSLSFIFVIVNIAQNQSFAQKEIGAK